MLLKCNLFKQKYTIQVHRDSPNFQLSLIPLKKGLAAEKVIRKCIALLGQPELCYTKWLNTNINTTDE